MAFNLIITEQAEEQLDRLVDYMLTSLQNPEAAYHLFERIEAVYVQLSENPLIFPTCKNSLLQSRGYREALLNPMRYRIVFRVEMETVYIVAFFHTLEDHISKMEIEDT
ncbi:MAG: type II toxin-antitoxin system RelE/ParE family toxin [Lachnospiraceae bacterium]|nr:type II toxin-antitoxin system RelE/ParE family toxin [Lachnospiraceae bacterium]